MFTPYIFSFWFVKLRGPNIGCNPCSVAPTIRPSKKTVLVS